MNRAGGSRFALEKPKVKTPGKFSLVRLGDGPSGVGVPVGKKVNYES